MLSARWGNPSTPRKKSRLVDSGQFANLSGVSLESPHELMDRDSRNISFRKLYPSLNDEELTEAQENLRRYLEIVREIQKEQSSAMAGSAVDSFPSSLTMMERSNVSLKK